MKKTAKKEQIKYKVVSSAQNFATKILNLPFSLIISSFIHSFSCCILFICIKFYIFFLKTYLVSFVDLRVFSCALYMPNIIYAN